MTVPRRVQQQPGFILHHRPFRDSSQILDVISSDHGKLALVARGSRGAKSRLKGLLRPFMPLSLSWVQRSDLGTLTGAEVNGTPLRLSGDALLSGFYVNELLLHFLHRNDPQPEIFAMYGRTIRALAATNAIAACLRQFEIELLRQIGYALNFAHEFGSNDDLQADQHYEYRFEQGPVRVQRSEGAMVFSGAQLAAVGAQRFDEPEVLRVASRLLREVIGFHLGGKELKSRKVLVDLHRQKNL
ncbi:MAG: DNA repair protein RecO [Gammaproteobacteria bacterium]|nr:DNA repair protein RecO [Gammaproteobacteria bacterium]